METLYDLLGALPRDDAEGLRTAFRRAVKGAHPDIHPGDPYAGLKFRKIVRAHQILGDVQQRAAYDHLLDLARQEREQSAKHALADAIHKLASGVMALTAVSAAAASGYLVLINLSTSAGAPVANSEVARLVPAAIVAAAPLEQAAASAPIAPPETVERADVPAAAVEPAAATVSTETADSPPASVGPSLDLIPNDAGFYRALGISAYWSGDLRGAIADFDQAIQFDPKFAPAYIDRGIVFYRLRKFDRAFSDIARAKHLERSSRSAPAAASAKKPQPPQVGADNATKPAPPRRTAEAETSRLDLLRLVRRAAAISPP